MASKVLLTGATGFLGKRVAECIVEKTNFELSVLLREGYSSLNVNCHYLKSIDSKSDFSQCLIGQDIVIHTAARVHIMRDISSDPLSEFRKVNVVGTLNLAHQAVIAGVKRFVFISSIKVNGESTLGSNVFCEENNPDPCDPYAVSKAEAEQALLHLSSTSGMEVVIIRPPLIYGPGVKGNFLTMVNAVRNRVPLPLGAVNNMRSFIALDNIVDLIITCINHPKAANQIFLASDQEDVSTTLLIKKIATAFDRKAWLIKVPGGMVKVIAKLMGKGPTAERLYGSLRINSEKAQHLLGWKSVITMDEQLRKLASHVKSNTDIK